MSIATNLASLPPLNITHYWTPFPASAFQQPSVNVFSEIIRISSGVGFHLYHSANTSGELHDRFRYAQEVAVTQGLLSLNLCLMFAPWNTYFNGQTPLSNTDLASETGLWNTWMSFWQTEVSGSIIPIKTVILNDTEMDYFYHADASRGIPNSGTADKATWNNAIIEKWNLANTTISGYFPQAEVYWYDLFAMGNGPNWRPSIYYPSGWKGYGNAGPSMVPLYYGDDITGMSERWSESTAYAATQGITTNRALLTFSGKSGASGYSNSLDWEGSADTEIANFVRANIVGPVFLWRGNTYPFNTDTKYWDHFANYVRTLTAESPSYSTNSNISINNRGSVVLGGNIDGRNIGRSLDGSVLGHSHHGLSISSGVKTTKFVTAGWNEIGVPLVSPTVQTDSFGVDTTAGLNHHSRGTVRISTGGIPQQKNI